MVRTYARGVYLGAAWLFVACLLGQVFLAGLGVFAGYENFETHRQFAYLFGWLTLILIVLAAVAGLPRRLIGWSALTLVLMALQSVFILFKSSAPAVAALHPVNGFLLLLLAIGLARAARAYVAPPWGTGSALATTGGPA
ncbi:MAG TPA: DUF6220 domain-containing protein [Candidatus Limnocylindrales bacterium]|nr:DUF6220 domain-containing protein [Candidatus Limnocylindrales bacterium]